MYLSVSARFTIAGQHKLHSKRAPSEARKLCAPSQSMCTGVTRPARSCYRCDFAVWPPLRALAHTYGFNHRIFINPLTNTCNAFALNAGRK